MSAIRIVTVDTCAKPITAEAKLVLLIPPQMFQVSRNRRYRFRLHQARFYGVVDLQIVGLPEAHVARVLTSGP